MYIPQEVNKLIEELHKAGLRPYLVGGALRDLLLDIVPLDYDIAFQGTIEQLERVAEIYHSNRIDRVHGTLSMSLDGIKAEITLFRKESGYSDARHPGEISFEADIREDLGRRDFAMNSMAYDFETQEIVDPFGARSDIENRPIRIRTTRKPSISFHEDALRMVRALRLLGRVSLVGNANFSEETEQALLDCREQVSLLRPEVVHREMMKIWSEPNTGDTFQRIGELDYLPVLFPAMGTGQEASGLARLNGEQPLFMKLAQFASCTHVAPSLLYDGLSYNKRAWMKADALYMATTLMNGTDIGAAKTAFALLGESDRELACQLYAQFYTDKSELYVRICEKHEALTVRDLDLGAKELLDMGLPREQVGSTQRWLLDQVYLDEALNDRKTLTRLLREKGKIDGKDTD